MAHRSVGAGLVLGIVVAAGCTTMGAGTGSTALGRHPVTFSWKGDAGSNSGFMTASFADGRTYSGQFFQITSNTTAENLGPLWTGWGPGWGMGGWYDWTWGPEFVTHYSGRVVANLVASDGSHMRCRFRLIHPDGGMSGGGSGECQLPNGKQIDAQFPSA
jgi:hypothetical protein